METKLAKIPELDNVIKESGLQLTDAEAIKQSYLPYFNQMAEIKKDATKINFKEPGELDEKIARELRLKTVKIRTGSEEVKNERKRIHLLKSNVEQAAWNLIKSTCQLDEELFSKVEKRREIEEKKRKEARKEERLLLLQPYELDLEFYDLLNMPGESFDTLLSNTKLAQEQKIAAEKKAEEERIAKEKAEKAKYERIRKENERLRKEAEVKKREAEKERKRIEAEREKERKETEVKQQAIEEKARKEREVAKEKARKEAEAKKKIEAELQAKKDEEAKRESDAKAAIEAELSKGDNEKYQSLITDMAVLKSKYTFKSKKYQFLQNQINELIDKIITFANSKT